MAKRDKTDRILGTARNTSRKFEPKTPLANDMFLPNHSGIAVHPEARKTYVEVAGDTMTGPLEIHGSSDTNQLVIKANATQSNSNPLLRLELSDGSIGTALHTDHGTNTFLGPGAGVNNAVSGADGTKNLFMGYLAGNTNTSGAKCTFVGAQAGGVNSSGDNNTFLGFDAGKLVNTGGNNLLLGYKCGDNLTTGANNIIIGHDLNASAVGVSNELNIGGIIGGDTSTGSAWLGGTKAAPKVTVLSDGRVGIGETSPVEELHISANVPVIRLEHSPTNDYSEIAVVGSDMYLTADRNDAGTGDMIFRVGGTTERMRIKDDGKVGVGTATPGQKLHVYGGASGQTPNTDSNLVIEDSGGNVLNMLSPSASYNGIYFGDASNANLGGVAYLGSTYSGALPANAMVFTTAAAVKMTIDSSGKVGVGTTTPATLLDINADSVRVRTSQSPASNGTGTQGEIAWDADYIYVCTATDTWKRAALTGGY